MKKCRLLSLLISLFVLASCQNNEPTDSLITQPTKDSQIPSIENTTESIEDIKINESLQFYKDELIKDLNSIKDSVLSNINDEDIYISTFSLIADCVEMVKSCNSFVEAREFYDYYLSNVYKLIPEATEDLIYTPIKDIEKVTSLLDEYAFRNHLLGALLSDDNLGYDSINLNTLDKESWEYFFGENGIIRQTAKENYWDVKPFMSNDNFIKGINLALDKSLFTDMEYEGDVENPKAIIDVSACDYYKYDVELARKYFKVALEEMIEQGIYDVSNLSEPINLTIEIAWNPWGSYNSYETYHYNIKTCLETVFNDESVTNGNFTLTVNAWQSEYFGQIYAEKIYVGQFDMSFGTISYSSKLDYYNEYLRLSSTNSISDGFNVNWSIDTSSLDDCIVYEGYKYSYDSLLQRLCNTNMQIDAQMYFKKNKRSTSLFDITPLYSKEEYDDMINQLKLESALAPNELFFEDYFVLLVPVGISSSTDEVNFLSATCNKYNEVSFNFSIIEEGTLLFDYYENLYFIKVSNEYKECTFLKNVIIVEQ